MTKTKFNAAILKTGNENGSILQMIAAHNEGKVILCTEDLISYANCRRALHPGSSLDRFTVESGDEPGELRISEDGGKTFTLIIQEIEIMELVESETN